MRIRSAFFIAFILILSMGLTACNKDKNEDPEPIADMPVYQRMYLEGGLNDPSLNSFSPYLTFSSHNRFTRTLNTEEYDEVGYFGQESTVIVILKGPKYDTFTDLVLSDTHYSTQCIYTATSTNYVVESVNINYVDSEQMYYTEIRVTLPPANSLGIRTIEIKKINFIRELINEEKDLEALIENTSKTTILFSVTMNQDIVVEDTLNNLRYRYDDSYQGFIVDSVISVDTVNPMSFNIPASFMGFPIKELGASLFEGMLLTTVSIPEGVVRIAQRAFALSSLTSINIPASVESIGHQAFSGDYPAALHAGTLTSVVFSLNSQLQTIESGAFESAINLTSINLPNQLEVIGSLAFYRTALTEITIPASVITIHNWAFKNVATIQSVYFSNDALLETIGEEAFYGLNQVTTLSFPETLIRIEERAFMNLTALTMVSFPTNSVLTTIGHQAFANVTALTSLIIPASVTTLGQRFITGATALSSLAFQSGSQILTINSYTFAGPLGVSSITIPASVTQINSNAFYNNTSIQTILFQSGSNLEIIGDSAFEGTSSLSSILIPVGVVSIGNRAFYGSINLSTVTFDENSVLETIGNQAFLYAHALSTITIPASVTHIGFEAFSTINQLTTFIFEEGIQLAIISEFMFSGSTALIAITIPASVTTIGNQAFFGATSLSTVDFELGSLLESIGSNAFNSTALETLILPNGVKSIGTQAFYAMTSLNILYLPATLITVEEAILSYANAALIVYSAHESQPTTWHINWNADAHQVNWDDYPIS